jgi:hypothetical protein
MTLSIGSVSSVSNGADTMASAQRHFEACEEEDAVVHGVSRSRTPPVFLVVVLSPVAASLDATRAGTSVVRSEECVKCAGDCSF